MTGRVVDTYTNITTVKLFSHAKREAGYAKSSMRLFLDTVYSQMRLVTGFVLSVWIVNIILICGVTGLGIRFWMENMVTTGAIAASIGLVLRLFGMSRWIMWEVSSLFENIGTVKDGVSILSKPHTILDQPSATPLIVSAGEIEFEDVEFSYGKESEVFDNFSLRIEPGEKVGLVGRSGAGKSTLVNLLLRFYDLEKGCIRIDGQDIATVTQESLRAQIGMVTQDTSLLHRSVQDNILYGPPGCHQGDVTDCGQTGTRPRIYSGFERRQEAQRLRRPCRRARR